MTKDRSIITDRLFLTPFATAHVDDLLAMNSDPDVMRYLGPLQTRDDVLEGVSRVTARWDKLGFGWWTVFLKGTETIIGAACLQNLAHKENAPLEIGWRLKTAHHGKGYATEAGHAAMTFGFERVGVESLCAVAHPQNTASQKVMQRLGMQYVGVQRHYDEDCVYYEKHNADQS